MRFEGTPFNLLGFLLVPHDSNLLALLLLEQVHLGLHLLRIELLCVLVAVHVLARNKQIAALLLGVLPNELQVSLIEVGCVLWILLALIIGLLLRRN